MDHPHGPIREIVITCPVHQRCIGPFIEEAAKQIYEQHFGRCLCLDCLPNLITVKAWHLYWAAEREKNANH